MCATDIPLAHGGFLRLLSNEYVVMLNEDGSFPELSLEGRRVVGHHPSRMVTKQVKRMVEEGRYLYEV